MHALGNLECLLGNYMHVHFFCFYGEENVALVEARRRIDFRGSAEGPIIGIGGTIRAPAEVSSPSSSASSRFE